MSSLIAAEAPDLTAAHRFQYICLAAWVLLAPVVLVLGFALDPTGGVRIPSSTSILGDEFRSAGALRVQLFLYFNAVTPFVFPLSFIGLGLLAMPRSPWFATAGTALGLLGSVPFAAFVSAESLAAAFGALGGSTAGDALLQATFAAGPYQLMRFSWLIGHLLGYVLLGIALFRARTVPTWAALLLILAMPLQAAAYPANLNILQVTCFLLVFIASLPAVGVLARGEPAA